VEEEELISFEVGGGFGLGGRRNNINVSKASLFLLLTFI